MKSKNRWLKRFVLLIIVLIISGFLLLFSYVMGHEKSLMNYQSSLSKLPEVEQVLEISEYQGIDAYYVAKVLLTNETEQYYFIKDNVVVYQVEINKILSTDAIVNKALSLTGSGKVKHYYLGFLDENPIYEVLVTTSEGEEYVILNALDGELISHFIID
ncbi:hypothetical protein GMA92_02675 [Turicibacter sanguinis]|uniref:DUF5590 domain-containing protein n=2 Tax=Turicibacter sanguinis TaxID=154288 RepID=A0A9X4XBG9_9FIRM|nr:hypothetical protein [Turicibacter sanguinis]EFF63013.1 hypothetical protein CUW_2104 [Turicibacter sanguinis PC909]MCU7191666.1 hypothetical protein [Turicibacter sanguinis]MTK20344.1 hypothetical protein [Turicibacter sanguinis]MTK71162.1 hypothetical protein [Turicibacter sanguinis]